MEEEIKILIADDIAENLHILETLLRKLGYGVITATDGAQAVKKAQTQLPDVILLDIKMPNMNGIEACKAIKDGQKTKSIPVIIMSSISDIDSRAKGLEADADDFIAKPFDQSELSIRVQNQLKIKKYKKLLSEHNRLLTEKVHEKTIELQRALVQLDTTNDLLRQGYMDTIKRLTVVSEFKDLETAHHISRVGLYCALVAQELGWSETDTDIIRHASPLHDIGKVAIPLDILLKQGPLSKAEFYLMQTHTEAGAKILEDAASKYLKMGRKIALSHHEKWGGNGYPAGLKGTDIHIGGRIVSMADQYDALRSQRPYKEAFEHMKTVRIITEGDGRTEPGDFDPTLLELFKEHHREFEQIHDDNMGKIF